jgi:hypothetical protein
MFFKRFWQSGFPVWLLLVPLFYLLITQKHKDYGLIDGVKYDQEGYYMHLPATFVYGSYTGFTSNTKDEWNFLKYKNTDKIFNKYTSGVALLQTPFYLIHLAVERIRRRETHLYISTASVESCAWGCAYYTMLGLFFLYKTIQRTLNNKYLSLFTVFAVYLGTCSYYYTVDNFLMSHIYGFTILSVLLWFTPIFYKKASHKNTLIMGLLIGLLLTLRLTNAIALFIVLFWEVYNLEDLKMRFQWLFANIKHLFFLPFIAFILFLPQMYWWHYWSGNWIMDTYYGEGFTNWKKPELLNVLFSRQNGLFTYSPILWLSLLGSIIALKYKKNSAPSIIIIGIICVYTFSSWWMWYFGGCYGARSFVDFSPIFGLSLAYFYQYLHQRESQKMFYWSIILTIFIVFYSIRMTYLYQYDWKDAEWTSKRYWYTVAKAFYLNKN